ncbi:MAG: hypothetical protein ACTS73_03540 [Arsenophonus sp. NEOnobi-MAG3]
MNLLSILKLDVIYQQKSAGEIPLAGSSFLSLQDTSLKTLPTNIKAFISSMMASASQTKTSSPHNLSLNFQLGAFWREVSTLAVLFTQQRWCCMSENIFLCH